MKRILFLCAIVATLLAQHATVQITSTLAGVNNLSVNDFDLMGAGNVKEMFSVSVSVTQTTAVRFRLELSLDGKRILTARTNRITNAGVNSYTFSNRELGKNIFITKDPSGREAISIDNVNTHGFKLFDGLSISPKLPEGKYDLRFVVETTGGEVSDQLDFRVQNNWTVLLSDPAGDISSPYPTFRWSGTQGWFNEEFGETKPQLALFVYEDQGGLAKSISRKPILETVLEENTATFTFPSANDRQLEAGKSYYWTVKVRVKGVNGFQTRENEYVKFTFAGEGESSEYDDALAEIIGPAYTQIKKELKGFKIKSINMNLNGNTAPVGLNQMKNAVKAFKEKATANSATAVVNVEVID